MRVLAFGAVLLASLISPHPAHAIPAFARRYGVSCHTCHEFHYPRLNAFGDRYRVNGYQLPDGAEEPIRAQRMIEPGTIAEHLTVFKEPPLSFRGQVRGELALEDGRYETRLFSVLAGGGSVARDVSWFFSVSPLPQPMLHHARIGLHNLGASVLGRGTLNLRAGLLLLLDFQHPVHRGLAPGPSPAGSVSVGRSLFVLDDASMGVELSGRPGWGPFFYQLAMVAGPPGAGVDRDEWKDVFGRAAFTLFADTSHELRLGAFGYLGRDEEVAKVGGVAIARQDDFWLAGLDLELDLGRYDLTGLGYFSRHSSPDLDGQPVDFAALRLELICAMSRRFMASVRFEMVGSKDDPSLRRTEVAPHLTYLISSNVLFTLAWRQDPGHLDAATGVAALEAVF